LAVQVTSAWRQFIQKMCTSSYRRLLSGSFFGNADTFGPNGIPAWTTSCMPSPCTPSKESSYTPVLSLPPSSHVLDVASTGTGKGKTKRLIQLAHLALSLPTMASSPRAALGRKLHTAHTTARQPSHPCFLNAPKDFPAHSLEGKLNS